MNNGYESDISIGATHKMNKILNYDVREKIYCSNSKIIETNDLLLVYKNLENK